MSIIIQLADDDDENHLTITRIQYNSVEKPGLLLLYCNNDMSFGLGAFTGSY